ncbi:MAG: polysaccharide deacetylase family protein [Accumulibacter sp.]|jgi:peptidoglycan/xylan/chitin deacetylase (PgdA/CDA1 family)|uniref:polysaccharide deacetylase family protein n=1 Tax=Accumulibacter sp. TaxID=2053492 RepID=UPI002FC3C849
MPLQFITYHRTEMSASGRDVYVLTHDEFSHQVDLIAQSGLSVLRSHTLDFTDDRYRIGITFDDGYKSDLINAECLARKGLTGWFFVSTANIGRAGYLDQHEIRELERLGMKVGSHSHDHVKLDILSVDESRRQIFVSKEILENVLGHRVDALAFPGGGYSEAVVRAARDAGFDYLLTTDWGVNRPPFQASRMLRRNNILCGTSDKDFLRLIRSDSLYARQAVFTTKQVVRALLPEGAYRGLRQWLR